MQNRLFEAIEDGDVDLFTTLSREQGFNPNQRHPATNQPAICFAISEGQLEITEKLALGADIHYQPKTKKESLIYFVINEINFLLKESKASQDIDEANELFLHSERWQKFLVYLLRQKIPLPPNLDIGTYPVINNKIKSLLGAAIFVRQWPVVEEMAKRYPSEVNFNTMLTFSGSTQSFLFYIAYVYVLKKVDRTEETELFELLKVICEKQKDANFNEVQHDTKVDNDDHIHKTALWMLILNNKIELVKIILAGNPGANFNVSATRKAGEPPVSIFWLLANNAQWALLLDILTIKKLDEIDAHLLYHTPAADDYHYESPLSLIKDDVLREKIIGQMVVRCILTHEPQPQNADEMKAIFRKPELEPYADVITKKIDVLELIYTETEVMFTPSPFLYGNTLPAELRINIADYHANQHLADWDLNTHLMNCLMNLFFSRSEASYKSDNNFTREYKTHAEINAMDIAKLAFAEWRDQHPVTFIFQRPNKEGVCVSWRLIFECLLTKINLELMLILNKAQPQTTLFAHHFFIPFELRRLVIKKIGKITVESFSKKTILAAIDGAIASYSNEGKAFLEKTAACKRKRAEDGAHSKEKEKEKEVQAQPVKKKRRPGI